MKLFGKTYQGLKGLLSGMGLTLGYFLRFDKVITQQYPENRDQLKLPLRTHTRIELVKEAGTGQYRCHACGLCVRACPNNSLAIDKGRDPATNKATLEKYVYHFDRCTLCGLCIDACRNEALAMGRNFETAVYDSSQLVLILNEPTPVATEPTVTAPSVPPPTSPKPGRKTDPTEPPTADRQP